MRKHTIDDIIKLGPCSAYTRERIGGLWGERDGLTAVDILNLDIPAADRLWAVLRLVDVGVVRRLAVDFAEHVVGLSGDSRVQECIDTTRAYLDGRATLDDLRDAEASAWAAGVAAGWAAAWAAYRASRAAAWAADASAWAADSAAGWAAEAAYWAAVAALAAAGAAGAADAEREWQTKRVREVLRCQ